MKLKKIMQCFLIIIAFIAVINATNLKKPVFFFFYKSIAR